MTFSRFIFLMTIHISLALFFEDNSLCKIGEASCYKQEDHYEWAICAKGSRVHCTVGSKCWLPLSNYINIHGHRHATAQSTCDAEINKFSLPLKQICYYPKDARNICKWFGSCLEIFKSCEDSDYPFAIPYGKGYCEWFQERKSRFTHVGQKWIDEMTICIQESLVPLVIKQTTQDCKILQTKAFQSYGLCFWNPTMSTNTNGFQGLSLDERKLIFWSIKASFEKKWLWFFHDYTVYANTIFQKNVLYLNIMVDNILNDERYEIIPSFKLFRFYFDDVSNIVNEDTLSSIADQLANTLQWPSHNVDYFAKSVLKLTGKSAVEIIVGNKYVELEDDWKNTQQEISTPLDQIWKYIKTAMLTIGMRVKVNYKHLSVSEIKDCSNVRCSAELATARVESCESHGGRCLHNECDNQSFKTSFHCSSGSCCVRNILPNDCGQRPRVKSTKIVNGHEAKKNSWPWQVSLQFVFNSFHFCGGSLIHRNWVVTAAHCINNESTRNKCVILGEHNLKKSSAEEISIRDFDLEFIMHPYYNTDTIENDIALIRLKSNVSFTREIQPGCLPTRSIDFDSSDQCYITGWGQTEGTGDQTLLNELKANVISNEKCSEKRRNINDRNICQDTIGACNGDSGGPLSCKKNNKWYVAGAASYVSKPFDKCKFGRLPNVYTRLSAFHKWIKTVIKLCAAAGTNDCI